MKRERKRSEATRKARVAVDAIKGQRTVNEIASASSVHPNQVTQGKKQARELLPEIFSTGRVRSEQAEEHLRTQRSQQIGQVQVALDWRKKHLVCSREERRRWIEPAHDAISIARQCELADLARSSSYSLPAGETEENLRVMALRDEQYTRTPDSGIRRMTAWLRCRDHDVTHKHVARLLRLMGVEALYPKPRLSQGGPGPRSSPYLLTGLAIQRPNHVWSTDITSVRLRRGFVSLGAIMDWYRRSGLAWEISVTMETSFCLSALDWALRRGTPEMFNSDQGAQFTSADVTGRLQSEGIRSSLGGRGRVFDTMFVERLWRTVKDEEISLQDYDTVPAAVASLGNYFAFYNAERLHQALGYRTPASGSHGSESRERERLRSGPQPARAATSL